MGYAFMLMQRRSGVTQHLIAGIRTIHVTSALMKKIGFMTRFYRLGEVFCRGSGSKSRFLKRRYGRPGNVQYAKRWCRTIWLKTACAHRAQERVTTIDLVKRSNNECHCADVE